MEEIDLDVTEDTEERDKKILETICSIKTLKNVKCIQLGNELDEKDILEINSKNYSIKTLRIYCHLYFRCKIVYKI